MSVSENNKLKIRKVNSNKVKPPKKSANEMTFMEHLAELRTRLVWSSIAVLIGTAISWYFNKELVQAFLDLANPAMDQIAREGHPRPTFVNLNIVNGFAINFEVALYAGFLLASPFLVFQLLDFMSPALEVESRPGDPGYEAEMKLMRSIKRSLVFFIPVVAIFFLTGIAFAYYLVLPSAIRFLLGFNADVFTTTPDVKLFIALTTKIMFWSGVVFELPIIMYLLARIRIVDWRRMVAFWKWALVLSLVVAAFITPSPDIFNQALISVPVFCLYWLGVLLARFA